MNALTTSELLDIVKRYDYTIVVEENSVYAVKNGKSSQQLYNKTPLIIGNLHWTLVRLVTYIMEKESK